MPWTFKEQTPEEFARNPLVAVVAQLQYYPILKLEERVSDFQERIRAEFPVYGRGVHRSIELTPEGSQEVNEQPQHVFRDRSDDWKITLRSDGLIVESFDHESREQFRERFEPVQDALDDLFSVEPKRFGLRYVNMVKLRQLCSDLGVQQLDWSELLNDDFLPLPRDLVSLEDTSFYSEVNSSMNEGRLVLRYGIWSSQEELRIDMDRYVNEDVQMEDIPSLIPQFAAEIYSLFRQAVEDRLLTWMSVEDI